MQYMFKICKKKFITVVVLTDFASRASFLPIHAPFNSAFFFPNNHGEDIAHGFSSECDSLQWENCIYQISIVNVMQRYSEMSQ